MQSKKKKRVLLMEASSRQVLPMARAFYAKGYDITTVCEHKSDLGNVTRFKHRCYVVKNIDSDYKTAEREEIIGLIFVSIKEFPIPSSGSSKK